MGDLHNHKKLNILINDSNPIILLPGGITFYIDGNNGANLYLNGSLLACGIHYTEIEQNGLGVGFEFFNNDDVQIGDYISVSFINNINI